MELPPGGLAGSTVITFDVQQKQVIFKVANFICRVK